MELKKEKKTRVEVNGNLLETYCHNLQMYKDPPTVQIKLSEFEEFAVERLKILRILEQINLKKTTSNFDEWKKTVNEELQRQCSRTYYKLIINMGDAEIRQRDHLSHFILRLAYCQSEEYRRWFISREVELFKFRWSYLSSVDKKSFLKFNQLNFTPLDKETCENLSERSGRFIMPGSGVDYYCVKWTDVLDLVRNRRVYLEQGGAYITSTDLITVLVSIFRTNLSHNLVMMSLKLPVIQDDERIKRLVKNLHFSYTGKNYAVNESKRGISLHNLDSLTKASFPLCMKQLHSALKTNHHLRHFGRQQFSLFLKGIGLSLEDALTFWRTEFTKKIDADQFDKKYSYNIRHNYGKEGKRANYTPYSCMKIIGNNPGPGEYHGCPFKHYDVQSLKQTFSSQHISKQGIEEILYYVNINQYQLACAKYFEVTHNTPILTGVNHPNQYFEESQNILSDGKPDVPVIKSDAKNITNTSAKTTKDLLNDSEFEGMDFDSLDNL